MDIPKDTRTTPAAVDLGSGALLGVRWAVFPCGWKWEIGKLSRENETPVALFEHKHHAEAFCREWWPQLGEVRRWPAAVETPRTCVRCHWAEQCTDGLFCVENEKAVEPGDTCFRFMPNTAGEPRASRPVGSGRLLDSEPQTLEK